ncbi:MAG TPA: hypothetical protein VGN57_07565 [Pirellulaceae bacterium]|jgi:hypothetical protein|nr:hypothetical protein [Pirellulaceae bacterium]
MKRFGDCHAWMAVLNVATGAFSTFQGLRKMEESPRLTDALVAIRHLDTTSPWIYLLGGLFTIAIGIGNWYRLKIALLGALIMIVASLYNAWFTEKPPEFEWTIYTLNAYAIVMIFLLVGAMTQRPSADARRIEETP